MNKQLLIIRHAKSDWGNASLSDFDRPLNARGHSNAPLMASRLLFKHIIPQLLVSSPALRAITTAQYFADILGFAKQEIKQQQAIYLAPVSTLLNVINNFDNNPDCIALFGHNPGLTNLALDLCKCDIYNIPTCGIVFIEFPFTDWKLVSAGTGELKFFDFPKSDEA